MRSLAALLLFWPPLLLAQFTQVQGTITDPKGLPYANGTITPTLVISDTPRFASSGFGYTPPNQPVGLDSKGSFVMQLGDVTQLLPPGGTWSFHVCSAAGTVQPGAPISAGPVCFDVTGVTISGTVQDLSSILSAAAPALTAPGTGGGGGVSSINGTLGALTFPNVGCVGTTCTQLNPITLPPISLPAGSLAGQGVGAFGISTQTTSTISPPSGTAWFWALNAGGPNYGWQPIPYLMVNGINPSGQVSAQQLTDSFPAAPANAINIKWQRSLAANTFSQQISGALQGDGVESDCLKGTAVFDDCLGGNRTRTATCSGSSGTCTASFAAFSAVPTCVATPTTNGVTSFFISATTTSSVTVGYSPSTNDSFQFLCFGAE